MNNRSKRSENPSTARGSRRQIVSAEDSEYRPPRSAPNRQPRRTERRRRSTSPEEFDAIQRSQKSIPRDSVPFRDGIRRWCRQGFRHQHDMRTFVNSILVEEEASEIANELGRMEKIRSTSNDKYSPWDLLESIVETPFKTCVTRSGDDYSFEFLIAPLLIGLSRPTFAKGCLGSSLKRIFSVFVSHSSFWKRAVDCLSQLFAKGRVSEAPQGMDGYKPKTIGEVMLPVVECLRICLTKIADAIAVFTDLNQWLERLESMKIQLAGMKEEATTKQINEIEGALRRCRAMASEVFERPRIDPRIKRETERKRVDRIDAAPGPGSRHPNGPRHDNDCEDFRNIEVTLTAGEALCEEAPYLPKPFYGSGHVENPIDRYLDVLFRLLREDSIACVRRGVIGILRDGAVNKMKRDAIHYSTISTASGALSNDVQMNIFRRAKLCDFFPKFNHPVCFNIEFDQPPGAKGQSATKRKMFWERRGRRILEQGSLVCLLTNVRFPFSDKKRTLAASVDLHELFDDILFGTVVEARRENMAKDQNRVTIAIEVSKQVGIAALRKRYENSRKEAKGCRALVGESLLMQIRGHFFTAMDPLLRTLQKHNASSVPFLSSLLPKELTNDLPHGEDSAMKRRSPPDYLVPQVKLDFSFLNIHKALPPITLIVEDPSTFGADLDRLLAERPPDSLILDDTQRTAFVAALSQSVPLIQGPPGTGKTYVGVQIVRALLANGESISNESCFVSRNAAPSGSRFPFMQVERKKTSKLPVFPIVCVCYTNHALDQFLEDLIKVGVPVSSIVRIGGRSLSELLQARTLESIRVSGEHQVKKIRRFGELRRELKAYEEQIKSSEELWSSNSKSSNHVTQMGLEYLGFNYPKFAEFFQIIDCYGSPKDDYQPVSKPYKLFRKWLRIPGPKSPLRDVEKNKSSPGSRKNRYEVLRDDPEIDSEADRNQDENIFVHSEGPFDMKTAMRDVLNGLIDPESVPLSCRNAIWEFILHQMRDGKKDTAIKLLEHYEEKSREIEELQNQERLSLVRSAKVVGFTTSGCAKYHDLLQGLQARVVICEEAGEVLEGHLTAAINSSTQHLILIGDHQQLRPKVEEYSLSEAAGAGYRFDISLFERMVESQQKSKPSTSRGILSNFVSWMSPTPTTPSTLLSPLVTLATQRRMHPNISELIRSSLYPNLIDHPSVLDHPVVRGMDMNSRRVLFFNHDIPENCKTDAIGNDILDDGACMKSYFNQFEAEMTVQLVRYFVRQGYSPDQIAVLTPYSGQLMMLQEKLAAARMLLFLSEKDLIELEAAGGEIGEGVAVADGELTDSEGEDTEAKVAPRIKTFNTECVNLRSRVRLATVDNFQGEEAEIVIVSTVRCNPRGETGFLKISNRVNVMISRAKHGMVLFGSASTVNRGAKDTLFAKALDLLKKKNAIVSALPLRCKMHGFETSVATAAELAALAEDGGCKMMCRHRLKCGHTCPRKCHPDDSEHTATRCMENCIKMLPCGHPCNRECSFECDSKTCDKLVDVVLEPCKHMLRVHCPAVFFNKLPKCPEDVKVNFPQCGHSGTVKCWQEQRIRAVTEWSGEENVPLVRLCRKPCGEQRDCGHACKQACGDCRAASTMRGKTAHHKNCSTVCSRLLICGHECGAFCHEGKACQSCTKKCQDQCKHSTCALKCSDVCPSCVCDCDWRCVGSCPNRRKCPLPCGSPCARLPCDRRCSKTLTCGHQCPSLCGERCPTSEYCREPGCAPLQRRDQVVDMILMTTLNDHDPNESPLIVLPCGHCYTMETLDGYCQINKFYCRDDKDWVSIVPLQKLDEVENIKVQCFECRHPVGNVNRYGRILKRTSILFMKQKHSYAEGQRSKSVMDELAALENLVKSRPILYWDEAVFNSTKNIEQRAKTDVKYLLENEPARKLIERNKVAFAKMASKDALPPGLVELDKVTPSLLPIVKSYQIHFHVVINILKIYERFATATGSELEKRTLNKLKKGTLNKLEKTLNKLQRRTLIMVNPILRNGFPEAQTFCHESKLQQREIELFRTELVIMESAMHLAIAARRPGKVVDPFFLDLPAKADKIVESVSLLGEVGRAEASLLRETIMPNINILNQQLHGPIYATVTLDEKRMIFETMGRDVGTGVGSFGGHWYECPNGHVYTIGECGGATQQSTCPECGCQVGGSGHQLSSRNTTADQFLRDIRGSRLL